MKRLLDLLATRWQESTEKIKTCQRSSYLKRDRCRRAVNPKQAEASHLLPYLGGFCIRF